MKKEFILPKYWYAKITKDNIELIKEWRKDKFNLINDISKFYYISSSGVGTVARGELSGVRWISQNQLLLYVLNNYVKSIPNINNILYLDKLFIKLNIK